MRFITLILFTFFLSCQPTEETSLDGNVSSKSAASSTPSRWPSSGSFPVSLKFGSDFDSEEVVALNKAAQSWNETNNSQTTYFTTSTSSFSARNNLDEFRDGELGVYKLFDWPSEMPESALAVTQIFGTRTSSGYIRIDHADVLLNYDFFDFTADESWGYDLETVVLHELGHFLGLFI